jgi:hypothetical protein
MPIGGGKHDITCPWVHEHTDALDTGAAYFEPDDLYPRGGFHCCHSHGHKFKIGALLEFLSVSVVAAKMKPTIKVSGGELHRIVDRAEQELARSGKYYQRGGLIASISVDPATGESQIIPTSKPAMTRALSCAAVWQRYDKRSDEWVMCDPPERHCIVLFDAQTYAHMPPLAGIARQPYMRASGISYRPRATTPTARCSASSMRGSSAFRITLARRMRRRRWRDCRSCSTNSALPHPATDRQRWPCC